MLTRNAGTADVPTDTVPKSQACNRTAVMQKLPDLVPAFSHHLKPLMRDGPRSFQRLLHGAECKTLEHCAQSARNFSELLGDAPFGYVNVFSSHVNAGFLRGSAAGSGPLLQGTGKSMRHVKLRPGVATNAPALSTLIDAAYSDIKARVENG
jgi:hypothetical protein